VNVTRATPEGAAYNDLRNLARRQGRPFTELLSLHALEGFLARLAISTERDRFVLKGGVLLAAYDLRRPTRDVDLQAQDLSNDAATVLAVVRSIAALPFADGLVFDTSAATAEVIRDEDEYSGVRVTLRARLATADVPLHIDVNVGDPISPAPQEIALPRTLGAPVKLRGYPMAMVHAEKIVTAVTRGTANTRWRDFGDIYSLAGRHSIAGDELLESLTSVSSHRGVHLVPLADVLAGYADLAQTRYAAWRRKQARDDLPESFQDVLDRAFTFADPALVGTVSGQNWDPGTWTWS
jgi:hypothetical protein